MSANSYVRGAVLAKLRADGFDVEGKRGLYCGRQRGERTLVLILSQVLSELGQAQREI